MWTRTRSRKRGKRYGASSAGGAPSANGIRPLPKCEESKEGDATFRTLTLKDGGVIKEKLLDAGSMSYRYAIIESPLPVKNYEAQFSVTPDDDDLDEINVVWSATYDANGKPDKEARGVIDGIFKAGIESIKAERGAGQRRR